MRTSARNPLAVVGRSTRPASGYRVGVLAFLGLVAIRRASWLWLALSSALVLAGCSAGQTSPPTTSSGATAIVTTTSTTMTPTTTTAAPVPTLGQLAGIFAHGKGFGQVKPSELYNGGDPTGLVQRIVWKSWGGPKAVGTGESDYVGPHQDVAQGTQERVTVVAFKLGTCDGKVMYQAVEWYFSQHGQSFNSNQYENVCAGTYVTTTTTA